MYHLTVPPTKLSRPGSSLDKPSSHSTTSSTAAVTSSTNPPALPTTSTGQITNNSGSSTSILPPPVQHFYHPSTAQYTTASSSTYARTRFPPCYPSELYVPASHQQAQREIYWASDSEDEGVDISTSGDCDFSVKESVNGGMYILA